MKSICLFSFFIFLLVSCTTHKSEHYVGNETYSIAFNESNLDNYRNTEWVDSIRLIALSENPDEDLQFKQIDKIVVKNGLIYVADTYLKRLIVFDENGNALKSVGTFGDGPGEYSSLTAFYVNQDNDVYVYDSSKNKIFLYDCANQFVKDFDVKFKAENFTGLSNGDFFFSLSPFNEKALKGKKIAITDKDFKVKTTLLEFDEYVDLNYKFISPLTEYQDNIVLNRGICNDIYVYSKSDGEIKIMTFDFGEGNVPVEKLKDVHSLLESKSDICYIASCPIVVNNTIFSVLNKQNELYTCIFDMSENRVALNKLSDYSVGRVNIPLSITDEGLLVSYFNEDIYPNYEKEDKISEQIKDELKKGGFVVCLSKLK